MTGETWTKIWKDIDQEWYLRISWAKQTPIINISRSNQCYTIINYHNFTVHIHLQWQKKYDWNNDNWRKEMHVATFANERKDKWKYINKWLGCIDARIGARQYLTGGYRTTIKEFTISSEAIERNVIMCFSTKKIIEIMKYRIISSANGSILPMHYGSHRCCTPVIDTPLLKQFSMKI